MANAVTTAASNAQETFLGAIPITQGWSIVIGAALLLGVSGTRFGPLAAGLGGVAVIYQLSSWLETIAAPTPPGATQLA